MAESRPELEFCFATSSESRGHTPATVTCRTVHPGPGEHRGQPGSPASSDPGLLSST